MRKELILLSCFLVLSFTVVTSAEDLEPPWFAGADGSGCTIWEFDIDPVIGEVLENPDGEGPTCHGYWPELDEYAFSVWPSYGEVLWDEGGQLLTVDDDETGFYMSIPDGEGPYLTLYAQITWSGEDNFPMLEGWSTASREGDCLFSEEGDDLDHWGDPVEIEPGVFHQTFYHTLEPDEIPPYVNLLIWWEGCEVYEVILDAIVHADPEADDGPGTRCGEWQMQVSNLSPADDEKHVDLSTDLSFQAPEEAFCLDPNADPNFKGPFEYDVYFGTEPNVLTMTQLADGFEPTNCNDVMVFDPCAGDLNLATKYYWRVDINDANGAGDPCFYEGPYFSFSTIGLADNISPADGAEEVGVYTDLKWAGDVWAATFDVYFSTDFDDVDDGTASMGNQEPNTYDPGTLVLDTEYFWRIDEVNGIALKGDIWSFTTDISTVVDNMDSYVPYTSNDISDTWLDRYSINTASEVYVETVIAEDGNSMVLLFDNTDKLTGNIYGSWTEASISDLVVGSDWNEINAKALFLIFYGDLTNIAGPNDKMYIALEDASANVGISYYPDVNDVKIPQWQEWNIDLEDFNSQGVDLTNVSKVAIGFGTYGGSPTPGIGEGEIYIDNILLFTTRCVQAEAPGDATGDCTVNTEDLEELQFGWLLSDYEVPPEEPNRDGLLVEYLFDTAYEDTSDNDRTGIPGYFASVSGGYLSLTGGIGGENIVEIPFGDQNPFQGSSDFSISMKFRSGEDDMSTLFSSSDVNATDDQDPNHQATHPMSIFFSMEAGDPDFIEAYYDNWWAGASGTELEEEGLVDEWVYVAVTYDADGGICDEDAIDPNECPLGEPTGYVLIYINGNPGWEGNFDPNIPDIDDDKVWIGDTASQAQKDDLRLIPFTGNIDNVRIYNYALTHSNVMWLADKPEPIYFPNEEPSNLYPKVGPYGWDPNNVDIVDFRDFAVIAENWLAEEKLWP
jgi:hypothetical protein